MKEEYDFTNAEQGKFHTPIEEIEAPQSYDFSKGVRGEYAKAYHESVNKQDQFSLWQDNVKIALKPYMISHRQRKMR